jgi:hypothetical protein
MKLIIAALCAMLSFGAAAQSTPGGRLGSQIGQAIFGNPAAYQDAYLRGQVMGAQVRASMEAARVAGAEADRLEYEHAMQSALATVWERAGLERSEAVAVASVYQVDPSERAIIERAKREGKDATIAAIREAYQRYNYLLADQLMIAYFQAADAERKAVNTTE